MKSKRTKKTDKNILSDSVRDYKIESNSISLLIDGMANSGGFESKNLWNGIDIIRTMTKDRNCTRFLSFVGSIISTGARGIIKDMLKRKMFDCVITTCGAIDHDIARTSTKYYAGDFRMDDDMLYRKNIHRLGNVLVPQNNYGPVIENKMQACLNNLYKQGLRSISTFDITRSIGETLDDTSFLYWAYKNNIPVIVPGIVDGAVGSQIWFFYQKHKDFNVNILLDETRLSDLVYEASKTGAFIIGGGISKHHTLWWNQFRGGLDYAVSITTASEWDGSLSGALVAEAISWGKVKRKARQTTIHGEATTLLPFMYAALLK